jgi:MerR family transcriptional regulator/heat shock protein HspR
VPTGPDPTRALYAISVAAQLTGIHPQSIRSYEDHGLVVPARTDGGTRRYSDHDITRLQRISGLLGHGLNLAGVEAVLALEATNRALREEIAELQSQVDRGGAAAPELSDRPPARRARQAAPNQAT